MSADEILTPVPSRIPLRKKADQAIADLSKKDDTIRKCFDRLANTEDGLFALQKIYELSGGNSSGLIMTALHDVSPNILLVKQGRSGLWQDLRKYFSRDSLIAIEYPQTKGQ